MNLEAVKGFLLENDGEDRAFVGGRLGRYQLLEVIASGGTAVVWRAFDPDLDRLVAIKVLTGGDDARLRLESTAAARLQHPNIVAVHEVGAGFIVMDLAAGGTLADALPTLPLVDRLRLLETVARAVEHAHQRGVIHRDLKPGNILVEPGGRILLTDFGVAKVAGGEDLTATGTVVGTPDYMAPEQVRGRAQGPAVDIWALGVLLYLMVSDTRPFAAATSLAVYERITRAEPLPLPGALGAIAAKALTKDPAGRYRSAGAFADELARHLGGAQVRASRVTPWLRRHRRRLGIGALGLAVMAAGGVAWRGPRAAEPALDAQLARFRASEDELDRQLTHHPGDASLWARRARLRRESADHGRERGRDPFPDYTAAEADARRSIELKPQWRTAHLVLGGILAQRASFKLRHGLDPVQDFALAEQALRLADPQWATPWVADVHYHRGLWREQAGGDGHADFETVLRVSRAPRKPFDFLRRARALSALGRHDDADRDFAAALALDPTNAWAWTWRGVARGRAGDPVAAEAHMRTALHHRRDHTDAWEQLGLLLARRHAWAAAAAAFGQTLKLNPSLQPVLGHAWRDARRRQEAAALISSSSP